MWINTPHFACRRLNYLNLRSTQATDALNIASLGRSQRILPLLFNEVESGLGTSAPRKRRAENTFALPQEADAIPRTARYTSKVMVIYGDQHGDQRIIRQESGERSIACVPLKLGTGTCHLGTLSTICHEALNLGILHSFQISFLVHTELLVPEQYKIPLKQ